jgi:hypothetical protein
MRPVDSTKSSAQGQSFLVAVRNMTLYRLAAPAVALILFCALSALYALGKSQIYYELLFHWGIWPFRFPFVDTSGSLAAWECTRRGLDVVEHDPCDVLGRAYSYSPLWMSAASIPLGVASTAAVGWTLGLVFIASLVLLPPPQRPWELSLVLLATSSTMVVFGVERGNPDLIVFLLATCAGLVALRGPPTRLLSYHIALFAALTLKYYPLTLMILAFRERIAVFVAVNLGTLSIVVIFALIYFPDLARGIPLIPVGPYDTDLFSAQNLPWGIAKGLQQSQLTSRQEYLVAGAVYAAMLVIGARICWHVLRGGALRVTLVELTQHEMIFLIMGSALIVGCFFAGQNIGYRGIFLLFVIPGLLAIARRGSSRGMCALGRVTAVLVVLIMWGECIRQNLLMLAVAGAGAPSMPILVLTNYFWLLRELAWWWVIAVLTAVLLEFVWGSQTVQAALALVPARTGMGRRRSVTDANPRSSPSSEE